jgi:rubrerythrin
MRKYEPKKEKEGVIMATYEERIQAEEDKHLRHSEDKPVTHCSRCGYTWAGLLSPKVLECPRCGSTELYQTR